jgi:hypothetical protein
MDISDLTKNQQLSATMKTEETPTSKKKREKTRPEDRIKELFEQQLQSYACSRIFQ